MTDLQASEVVNIDLGRAEHGLGQGGRPLVRDYMILCQSALLILTLILVGEGYGWWSILPLLVGSLSLAASWGIGPMMVLFCLTVLLSAQTWFVGRWYPEESSSTIDLLVAGVTLVYVAGATRLLSLLRHTVPPDYRRGRTPPGPRMLGRWLLPKEASNRSGLGVSSNEIVVLLLVAPPFVVVAYLLWFRMSIEPPPEWMEGPLPLWHVMILVWVMGIGLAGAYSFLAYLGRMQAGPEESLLYLQDQLWTATRGEQRRINRWVVWRRLRAQRKEEKG